jgi:MYXO-CTERM domain-containing protein
MCVCAAALTLASVAPAQVTQTDAAKTPLPQPVPAAEADLVNNSWAWNANTMVNRDPTGANLNPAVPYGTWYSPTNTYPPTPYPQFVTGDAINLSGLFKWRREMIDPKKDAKTGPGYFSAKCGFTGELLLMGGNCQAQFGWYNVTDPTSKTPPTAAEIYPFITGKPQDQLNCVNDDGKTRKTDGFCPLAWDNRHPYDLSIIRWTPKQIPSGDISKNPNYKGGYVAFAVIGDPAKCPQNKYSMYEHNQRNSSNVPWVTTLIYHSTVDPGGFYMAFEDLPMSAADWTKGTDGKPGADGDFNDFVFYVSGLTCAGGNLPCDTGLLGACSVGHTDCAGEGETSVCRPVIQKGAEVCDNVDNDCDGVVDNGDGLCPADKPICFQGSCVGPCGKGEFQCPTNLTCDDSGHCADPVCASVSCKAGTACRNGQCVDPCTGVTCPYGETCQLGTCVDPCKGVTCPADRVCEKGLCLSNCSCRGCDDGLTCASDGRCLDSACATKMCAAGTVCKGGECIDPCVGVSCPGGGVCSQGTCSKPMSGTGAGGSGDGLPPVDFTAGNPSVGTGAGPNGSGNSAGTGSPGVGRNAPDTSAKGCGCRVGGDTDAPSTKLAWLSALLGLGLTLHRRRVARSTRI